MIKKYGLIALVVSLSLASCEKKTTEGSQASDLQDTVVVEKDSAQIAQEKKAAQEKEKAGLPKPYNAEEDADQKIKELIAQAQKENKNIIMQAGGNWCIWCLRFNNYVQTTPELKEIIDNNYLYYHLNYSPENKNEEVFARYGDPGKEFGYPVFIVLDKNGKQIHIQESGSLEEDKGYSLERVKAFFNAYLPEA